MSLRTVAASINSRRRTLLSMAAVLACAGCSDPKAVQTFAGMAPDQHFAVDLSKDFVAEPRWRQEIDGATGAKPSELSDRNRRC